MAGIRSWMTGAVLLASLMAAVPARACAPLTIYFDWNSSQISPESAAALERLAVMLAWKGPDLDAVEITSHTDSSGSFTTNRNLAWGRARAVRDVLLSHGVPERLISMEAMVNRQPRVRTPAHAREPANRRVELLVQFSAEAQGDALREGAPIC